MRAAVDLKTYYSWVEVWQGSSKRTAEELAFAIYNVGLSVDVKEIDGHFHMMVPYPQAALATEMVEAFKAGRLEYPTQLSSREGKETYEELTSVPPGTRRSGLVLIFMALMLFYAIFQILNRFMSL